MLLEGLISLLIFSLGVLAIIGLQASTMKATTQAKTRIDASLIANQRVASIWVDMANKDTYKEKDTEIAELPNGTRTTEVVGDEVTVTVSWKMPGDSVNNTFVTVARVNTNPL
jgi:type IV pilus assembly protein PilV